MEKLLFIDIETHRVDNWNEISPILQKAFADRSWDSDIYDDIEECFNESAGLSSAFSKVICISMGYEWDMGFKLISIAGLDEKELLGSLNKMLFKFNQQKYSLAGHNIKGFDIPYLCQRYIVNNIKIPALLNSYGKKPWEIEHVDTMEMWKFGGWQNVSLQVICASLGLESKTTDITGSNLYRVDIKDMDWEELKKYCESDVKMSYEIYKRIKSNL